MRSINFSILFLFIIFSFEAFGWNTPSPNNLGNKYQPWTWTGAGGDALWTNGNNWCGSYLNGACQGQVGGPGATATVIFDNTCQAYANCSPTMPGGTVSLKGLSLLTTFNGTIALGATNLVIGTGGLTQEAGTLSKTTGTILIQDSSNVITWTMRGGTFSGGSGNITFEQTAGAALNKLKLQGGTFTSTSGIFSFRGIVADFSGLTSFTHNGGTFSLDQAGSNGSFTTSALVVFNHLIVTGSSGSDLSLITDIIVDGNLTAGHLTSNFYIRGGKYFDIRQGNVFRIGRIEGSAKLRFSGIGTQTLDSSTATSPLCIGIIDAQTAVPASVRLVGDVTTTGGFVTTGSLGTFDLNGAAVILSSNAYSSSLNDAANFTFPSLTIVGRASDMTFGTINVLGNLTIAATSSTSGTGGGVIKVGGDVNVSGSSWAHTVQLELNGSSAQLINIPTLAKTLPGLKLNNSSGGITFNGNPTITGSFEYVAGAVTMPPIVTFSWGNVLTITGNGLAFNEVIFNKSATTNITGDMIINGDLRYENGSGAQMNGGRFLLSGNMYNKATAVGYWGSTVLRLAGTGQTIDFTAYSGTRIGHLEIAAAGTTTILGTINAFQGNVTHVSGIVDASTSTFKFDIGSGNTQTITPNTMEFNNVEFNARNIIVAGGTMVIRGTALFNGNLLASRALTGTIDIFGNVTFSGLGMNGAGAINLKGSNSTLSSSATSIPSGTITVSKTAGQRVTLASNFPLNAAQNMSVTTGQVDLSGFTLTLSGGGALSLSATTTVKLSSGVLSVGGSSIGAGAYSSGTVIP